MRIGIVGCGFVADYYVLTLPNHPKLQLIGVTDRDQQRAQDFAKFHSIPKYDSLHGMLDDDRIELVLNLTNPRSHYEVTRACLEAGKHVYSEKPLAMKFDQATELVELAESQRLHLSSAPCNVLGEAAQTAWRAIREGNIGTVRLAYAELDDGLIHRMRYRHWKSESGVTWPWKDEFEVGCTLEHAAYYVTWLCAFFGPAQAVTSFASCQIPDKETDLALEMTTPDFSVACIQFHSGVVARLTCSVIASHDHQLRVFGDKGVLSVRECWDYRSPVYIRRLTPWSLWFEKWPRVSRLLGFSGKKCTLVHNRAQRHRYKGTHMMDFSRGIADLAASVQRGHAPTLTPRFALHVNEIVLTIQHPEQMCSPRELTTTFDAIEPQLWSG